MGEARDLACDYGGHSNKTDDPYKVWQATGETNTVAKAKSRVFNQAIEMRCLVSLSVSYKITRASFSWVT